MNSGKGKIQTVNGLINSDQMGSTLPHEHIFLDLSVMAPKALGFLFNNFKKTDFDNALNETAIFKEAGGCTIIDVSPSECAISGKNPQPKLVEISRKTGVNIVCGTSYYTDNMWTKEQRDKTTEEIADLYISNIENGFGDTGIKPGVIGEIGVTWPIADSERKSLEAAAIASVKTGLPISIHSGFAEEAPKEIVALLTAGGVSPNKIILGHMASAFAPDRRDDIIAFAKLGTYLEFDQFATKKINFTMIKRPYWTDEDAVEAIKFLVDEGFGDKLLISCDMTTRSAHTYKGGHGYTYIPKVIVPMMREKGLTEDQIRMITVENPARALSI